MKCPPSSYEGISVVRGSPLPPYESDRRRMKLFSARLPVTGLPASNFVLNVLEGANYMSLVAITDRTPNKATVGDFVVAADGGILRFSRRILVVW